ncbi:glycosyltransferase family A protein [Novosphingobium sp. SL115]|uniref:glycosyltransferase family 2 protein n=1 Tax=Novosphingobium sp. SL115 TaxID=2995150 RepID=UPI0022747E98|nr:glycosyltransferase family A protein [Novosphingobium sp. SL115]MCY1670654.1 glycosyltransferase family A protein [Novosphingobium sp. SL115]
MPEVSVVIPMYNGEKFIAEALESVLASEGVQPEIIVVDDGSSDSSAQIAQSYAGVIVHRQPNGGEAAARKTGYEMATGDFIVFLDCDDLLHPQAIQHHLAEIKASDEIDMVFRIEHPDR